MKVTLPIKRSSKRGMKGGGREAKQDAATTETAMLSPFAIRSTNKFHSGDMFLDEREPSSDTR